MASSGLLHYKNITLDKVLEETEIHRKTKIICTIGPSCNTVEKLVELIDAGLNICRLNFSHGDHESHLQTVRNIVAARSQRPDKHIAILLDTKGPEIRTGFLEEPFNKTGLELTKGQTLEIVTDYTVKGNKDRIACSYDKLAESVAEGDTILAADGSLVMKVLECRPETKSVVVTMKNTGIIGERKNMNLPGNRVQLPTIGEKDKDDLSTFAKHIDFVAASFVQRGSDMDLIKNALGEEGKYVKVIAKIENQEGLHNFDSILETFDAIMVARGDLGMEIPIEKVFLAQKMLIRKCNVYGKPVVTATQMLESMTKNPRPTRAETTDVANAVLDGTDCVMLSGETAGGAFPVESCETIAAICREAENIINHEKLFSALANSMKYEFQIDNKDKEIETIASSVVKAQLDSEAKLIVIVSETGDAARRVAKYRPGCIILVLTGNERLARQLNGLVCAIYVHTVDRKLTVQDVLNEGMKVGKTKAWVKAGDSVVLLKRVKRRDSFKHLMEITNVPDDE